VKSLTISVDLKDLIGPNIDLQISDPEKKINSLSDFKDHSDPVQFYQRVIVNDDVTNIQYIVKCGQFDLIIPLSDDDFQVPIPKFENPKMIGSTVIINKSTAESIRKFHKNRMSSNSTVSNTDDSYKLIIYDNQLKGINIPYTANISFSDKERLDEDAATLTLLSSGFLSVEGIEYKIRIMEENDCYWMACLIDIGISMGTKNISIETYEELQNDNNEVIF
jgi:hypothetical protein